MGWAGAVDACRAGHLLLAILLHEVAAVGGVVRLLRCCESGLGRVHVEKEAVADDDEGASIAGGKRDAKAFAGHSALRVSMLPVELAGESTWVVSSQTCAANFPSRCSCSCQRYGLGDCREAPSRVSKANDASAECRQRSANNGR